MFRKEILLDDYTNQIKLYKKSVFKAKNIGIKDKLDYWN